MNNPTVSVIVPVYNVDKYLKKCLESILNQTYKNLEIILIDDGSIDFSGKICDDFRNKYDNIVVHHTENFGVSHARNIGLDNVKGEYFIFIDADDYIKTNMIENLYNNIIKYNADMSVCNVIKVDENGYKLEEQELLNKVLILDRNLFIKNLYNFKHICGYPVNKLIKSSVSGDIRFDESIKHLEDWDYFCRLSENINKVVYDGFDYYYYYVNHSGSAVNQKFNESWTTDLKARAKNIKYVDLYEEYERDRFYFDYVITILNTIGLYKVKKIECPYDIIELNDIKSRYYPIIIKSSNISKAEKIKLFLKYRFPILYFRMMLKFK